MEKRIGKIKSIEFGEGGYQDAMIGFTVELGSDKDSWGVVDHKGAWSIKHTDGCKWTEAERIESLGRYCMWMCALMKSAKKHRLRDMVGVPVEVEFEGNILKSWRVLEEVI